MFQRRARRFRRRPNDKTGFLRGNGHEKARLRSNTFSNSQIRNKFRATLSAEKLFEKYNTLAKEALSSGDETTCENYLQHADHFARISEKQIIEKTNKSNESLEGLDSTKKESTQELGQKNILE